MATPITPYGVILYFAPCNPNTLIYVSASPEALITIKKDYPNESKYCYHFFLLKYEF